MMTETLPVGYFGKIPQHGDFVRHQAGGAALRAMDAWLQEGLRFAAARLGSAFDDAFDALATCAFYFAPRRAERVLAGVLQPSRDRVGRAFPLLLALDLDAALLDARHLAQMPLRFDGFLSEAATLATEAAAGHLARETLAQRTDALAPRLDDNTSVAFFGRYLQQTTLADFFARLWGHPQDSRKYLLFNNLLGIVPPLRSGIPRGFSLVLRFPLCPDGRTLDFDVSFWLGVCLRLLGYPEIRPSFFWTHPQPDGGPPPFMLLALRAPAPRMLAYLLPAPIETDDLCVLETLGAQRAALAALAIPDHYGRLLEDNQLTLWDFLKQL